MKMTFSKKTTIIISLFFLFLNPSMAENQSPWKKMDSNINKKDCVNCYADLNFNKKKPKVDKDKKEILYAFNDEKSKIKTYNNNGYEYKIEESDINPKAVEFKDEVYMENQNISNSEETVAIQVGAFRHYSGAKKYVKKYAILSSEYKVIIKTGTKNQKPLYRVRIEGFSTRSQAEEFKKKYGLVGAFLVMK